MTLTFNAWQVSTSSTTGIRHQKGGLEGRNGGFAAISPFQPAQYSECVGGRACRDLRQFAMHPSKQTLIDELTLNKTSRLLL
jgi:hypothetical protein